MRPRIGSRLEYLVFSIVAGLVALPIPTYSDDSSEEKYLRYVGWLCEWAAENAPQTNPVHMQACEPGATVNSDVAQRELSLWWSHWRETDPTMAAELERKWNVALGAIGKKLERVEAARARAAAAKDRAARIAHIPKMSVAQLCSEYRLHKTAEALTELHARFAFPSKDLPSIDTRTVNLGISEAAMLCIMGPADAANRSVGSWGTHIQFVYRGVANIYTENGVVTSWQD